jgi:formylglycine-generating enzyme required for sulfatase activity
MGEERDRLQEELARVEQALAAQEGLRGILPQEQVDATLTALQEKRAALQAQLSGERAITPGEDVAAITAQAARAIWQAFPTPPPPEPAAEVDLAQLRHVLAARFSREGLNDLCFELGIDHEEVPGQEKSARAREIVQLCARRGRIPELIRAARRLRPDVLWDRDFPGLGGLEQITQPYLAHLVDRYRYLDFRGMGVSDRVPLRLPLLEMYVPLKARVELPEGETWARDLRLAGRKVSPEEAEAMGRRMSEPTPVLDLLSAYDGLVLLGDPGAGKTTFLKYLTVRLALGEGEGLDLGARLPVLVPLSAYANALESGDVPLDRFIPTYYRDRGVDLPVGPVLEQALARGGALLLLDGLDEVKELARRHLVVRRVEEFFTFQRGRGNKFVLTSRVVGYREVRPTAEGLVEGTLVDFEEDEIGQFVHQWTGALERAARGDTPVAAQEAEREREELLEAVRRNPGVRRLAANPLLLTILALMKRQGVALPERRVELYQKYVETLLKHWNLARGLDRPPSRDLDLVETVRVLAPLALWMHLTSPGVGLVKREAVRRKLEEIYAGRGIPEPERAARRLLEDVREHAGLLLERGPGEYGFIHLTFQEYLAAVAVAQRGQREVEPVVEALAARVGDDNWREVTLLAVGYMGIVQQRDEAAGEVVWGLVERAPGEPGQAAALAGEAVVDAWPGGVTPHCREQVLGALLETLADDGRVQPHRRAAAGDALARLGDPRREVLAPEATPWCYVPAGPFWMGSPDQDEMAYSDEKPLHRCEMPYDYWLARYPVTVAQFRAFVEASGFCPGDSDSLRGLDNHPVVWVSWHEARAYCEWLTERLRERARKRVGERASRRESESAVEGVEWGLWEGLAAGRLVARLPSEAEWEKGARGGLEIPRESVIVSLERRAAENFALVQNPQPRRRYPWGEEPDPNRANYGDTRIGGTSPVGCFPGGRSPYGPLDMAGNVFEWTLSLWGKESKPEFGYPYDPGDGRENLRAGDDVPRVVRGGAFDGDQWYVRCAYRFGNCPDYRFSYWGWRVVVAPVMPLGSGASGL